MIKKYLNTKRNPPRGRDWRFWDSSEKYGKSSFWKEHNKCYGGQRPGNVGHYVDKIKALEIVAKELPPNARILEIGFHCGNSAYILLDNAELISQFISIDHGSDGHLSHVEKAAANFVQSFKNFKFIRGDSKTCLEKLISEKCEKFDLIHVDGGHEYFAAYNDMLLSDKLLRPGGILVLDDIDVPNVQRSYQEILLDNSSYEYIGRALGGWNSLFLVKKNEK